MAKANVFSVMSFPAVPRIYLADLTIPVVDVIVKPCVCTTQEQTKQAGKNKLGTKNSKQVGQKRRFSGKR